MKIKNTKIALLLAAMVVLSISVLAINWRYTDSQRVSSCVDGDRGLNSQRASFVKAVYPNEVANFTYDRCSWDGQAIVEFSCARVNGQNRMQVWVGDCANGCAAGRCNP